MLKTGCTAVGWVQLAQERAQERPLLILPLTISRFINSVACFPHAATVEAIGTSKGT
jgi:hypothetical protein